jgi:hypothetical protein
MSVNKKRDDYIAYTWVIFMIAGLIFFFITSTVEMPYDKWISSHLPTWLAVLNYGLFGIFFVILAVPNRSVFLNYLAGAVVLFTALFFKASYPKAPLTNSILFILSVLLFAALKYHYRGQKKESG